MQKNDSYLKRLYQQVTHYWKKILKKKHSGLLWDKLGKKLQPTSSDKPYISKKRGKNFIEQHWYAARLPGTHPLVLRPLFFTQPVIIIRWTWSFSGGRQRGTIKHSTQYLAAQPAEQAGFMFPF